MMFHCLYGLQFPFLAPKTSIATILIKKKQPYSKGLLFHRH